MEDGFCAKRVPAAVSSFVDAFVDFVVSGGQFLSDSHRADESEQQQRNHHHQKQGTAHPDLQTQGNVDHAKELDQNADHAKHQKRSFEQNNAKEQGHAKSGRGIVTRMPAAERLVAIGDIHGDLAKAKESLRVAGVLDEEEKWTGGKTVVVQVGDLLDRGGEEIKVIYLLERLKREAQRQGGDIHIMNGNHETMNIEGDFRYATKEGLSEFERWGEWYRRGQTLKQRCHGLDSQPDLYRRVRRDVPEGVRSRYVALRPGGPISSRFLADHPTVLMVGSTVFAHAGILPVHAEYGLERMNSEVREWILGKKGLRAPDFIRGKDAVVWTRQYSMPFEALCDCKLLDEALKGIAGAERMVVGHTVQAPFGINGACHNRVIRVDVGMSKGCNNSAAEVLEIRRDGEIKVLSKEPPKDLNEKITRVPPGLASLLV